MSTMKISLPAALQTFIDEQVDQGGYDTSSDYVGALIRKDQDRLRLRGLLLGGAASPPTGPVGPEYFVTLRDRVRGE